MDRIIIILIAILFFVLCGCQNTSTPEIDSSMLCLDFSGVPETPETTIISADFLTVNGKEFSVEQINKGIKTTVNNVLYYHGNNFDSDYLLFNTDLLLGKCLEYELYFSPDATTETVGNNGMAIVYFVITNVEHRLSTPDDPKLYAFGIEICEYGLCSDFYYQGYVPKGKTHQLAEGGAVYLGSYSMCLNEVLQPAHEEMSDEWQKQAEEALKLYMDKNDLGADPENHLQPGKYTIYIEGFSQSDNHSTVIFEHENGSVYSGSYRFVHHITDGSPANLNKVLLVENCDADPYQIYLERVRSNATLVMVYRLP